MYRSFKKGFSFVDIIITLVFIGFVFTFVFPSFLQYGSETKRYTDKKNNTSIRNISYQINWRSQFATLSQTANMISANNGGSFQGLCSGINQNSCLRDKFLPNVSVIKICDAQNSAECWYQSEPDFAGMVLVNGTFVSFKNINTDCPGSYCGQIYMDMNGFKGPNIAGQDIFWANISPNSIKSGL